VPWLKAHLFDAVDAYARGIEVDSSAIERAMGSIDPSTRSPCSAPSARGLFELEPTPVQQAALARLETALALVEGWVDAVVDAAAADKLPSRPRCARRCAAARLRRPGRADLRDPGRPAAAAPPAARGGGAVGGGRRSGRHRRPGRPVGAPDLLPSAEDLDDPDGFVARSTSTAQDWDAGLRDLDKDLDGTLDADATGGPDGDGPDGTVRTVRATVRAAARPSDGSARDRPAAVRAPSATAVTLRPGSLTDAPARRSSGLPAGRCR
jgi:hypothetical protein